MSDITEDFYYALPVQRVEESLDPRLQRAVARRRHG